MRRDSTLSGCHHKPANLSVCSAAPYCLERLVDTHRRGPGEERVARTETTPEMETIPIAFEPGAMHLSDTGTGRWVEDRPSRNFDDASG